MTFQMTGTSSEISQSFSATPLSLWLQPGILSHAGVLKTSGLLIGCLGPVETPLTVERQLTVARLRMVREEGGPCGFPADLLHMLVLPVPLLGMKRDGTS